MWGMTWITTHAFGLSSVGMTVATRLQLDGSFYGKVRLACTCIRGSLGVEN
jgi:hypothetical protein